MMGRSFCCEVDRPRRPEEFLIVLRPGVLFVVGAVVPTAMLKPVRLRPLKMISPGGEVSAGADRIQVLW